MDDKKEIISLKNKIIKFNIKKYEIDEAIVYFNEIKIQGKSLEYLCDMTSLDKNKKKKI